MNKFTKLGCQLATASMAVVMLAAAANAASHAQGTVTVQRGDTLTSIAQEKFNDASMWKAICEANADTLNGACDNLEIGTVLTIPADAMMKDGMEKDAMEEDMADDKMDGDKMDGDMEKSEEMMDETMDKETMDKDAMEKDTMDEAMEMTDKEKMAMEQCSEKAGDDKAMMEECMTAAKEMATDS